MNKRYDALLIPGGGYGTLEGRFKELNPELLEKSLPKHTIERLQTAAEIFHRGEADNIITLSGYSHRNCPKIALEYEKGEYSPQFESHLALKFLSS